MDLNKNILNPTNYFQTPLPLNPNRHLPQRPLLIKHSEEEVLQSFKIKRNALMEALQSKKEGKLKNYYQIINRQGFVNAKEDSQALRIWVKVFLETITNIIHDYQDSELLELIVFKLPWFTPTTTHGQNFNSFMRLCLAIFPHDVSYIHKVIKHIFSPHGLFQCVMLGEHRPALADLLWERAQLIIKSFEMADESTGSNSGMQAQLTPQTQDSVQIDTRTEMKNDKSEIATENEFQPRLNRIVDQEQIAIFQRILKEQKSSEDILARAKSILRNLSDQNQNQLVQVTDLNDQLFLRVLFSFHPNRELPSDYKYPIFVGKCQGYPTFFVNSNLTSETYIPEDDDAISVKKCLSKIVQAYSLSLKIFAEKKFNTSTLKKLGIFFSKVMNLYPFAHQFILQNLLEKLPHKSMPIENQYLYYRMVLDIAKSCPENEERILLAIVEKLCYLDVDLKSKIRKFQFSQISKIQPMNYYIKELQMKLPTDKETKMSILFEMLLSYIFDRVKGINEQNNQSNNFDEFIESMMKIFESKIFPIHKLSYMQYLPLYVISLSSMNEKLTVFTEKYLSFLIFKSFNMIDKEHLSTRQQAWNYLASLLARQNNILGEKTLMKSLQYVIKFFDNNSSQKTKARRTASNHSSTEASDNLDIKPNQLASQDKILMHCFIQGLTLILCSKIDQISQYDHDLFTQMCKHIFKKNFSSLIYASPLILSDLVKLTESNKLGLGVFKTKLRELFKQQSEELKSSRRQVYNKVSKFMAYEVPITAYPVSERFQNLMIYEDLSTLPSYSTNNTPSKSTTNLIEAMTESAIMTENESHIKIQRKLRQNNEEIDIPTSSQEEDKRNSSLINTGNQSDTSTAQAVLYVPDASLYPKNTQEQMIVDYSAKGYSLESVISQSKGSDTLFRLRPNMTEKSAVYQRSSTITEQISKLNHISLSALNAGLDSTIAHSEDMEVASSGRDTEYSISPSIFQKQGKSVTIGNMDALTEKSKRNRSIQRTTRNIMMNLKEENDRADAQDRIKSQQNQVI
eukprot:403341366